MDFPPKLWQYGAPVIVAGLAVGMVPLKRDEAEPPHTHSEEHVPINAWGHASIVVTSTSSVPTVAFTRTM